MQGAPGFNSECSEAFFRAAQGPCFKQVTAYQECVAGTSGAQLPPTLCAQIGGPTSDGCVEDRKCLNSTWYNLTCKPSPDGQSSCTCKVHGDFTADITLTETVSEPPADACRAHIDACLAATSSTP
jgi:hypothetical protein